MSGLAPDLFQRRFQDFLEIGRARLPALAPVWTDHNAHDPGITLMELLAWVAEAQLYSLSRLRRDERVAYAALLGVAPSGTSAARGLIWSDRLDPQSPAATFLRAAVIEADAEVTVVDVGAPSFRPTHKLLWVPGRVVRLEARGADGRTSDLTAINERGGTAFRPFGERAGRRDVLALTFRSRDEAGPFGVSRPHAKGARWAIGVRAAPPVGGAAAEPVGSARPRHSFLEATLVAGDERISLAIASDTTEGLLTTGALLLDLDNVRSAPQEFTIELRAPGGFARPPRLLRIEPNVIPVEQGRTISREPHVADGRPDQGFRLDVPGLRFAAGAKPLTLEVDEPTGRYAWERCDRLSEHGPNERVYEFDPASESVLFGNGVNGMIPSTESQVLVSYAVSDADQGVVARNRKWKVAGFAGTFGVNPDPVTGGAAPSTWIDQRRGARRRSREAHALVGANDIVAAAKALPLLEVARAWVVASHERTPRTGALTLVAMRGRPGGIEPEDIPETPRWLDAIRRRLVARMPLGTRLVVAAPRYVGFSIRATLEGDPGRDPATVKEAVETELRTRLALVSSDGGPPPRRPGVPVTYRDLAAWLRAIDGVRRVMEIGLIGANGRDTGGIAVPPGGLPRWNEGNSTVVVSRPGPGSAP